MNLRPPVLLIATAALAALALVVALREPDQFRVRDATTPTPAGTEPSVDQPVGEAVGKPAPAVAVSPDVTDVAAEDDGLPTVAERQPLPAEPEDGSEPQLLEGELPHYLDVLMRSVHAQRDLRGCNTAPLALVEMAEEARDELWAARMERELGALLGRHPLGFRVTVSCRATVCQATDYGNLEDLRDSGNQAKAKAYWDAFRDTLGTEPMADEIDDLHGFAGTFTPEPGKHIAGYVLVGVGRGTSEEPAHCQD